MSADPAEVLRQIVAWDNHTHDGDEERDVCPTCLARRFFDAGPSGSLGGPRGRLSEEERRTVEYHREHSTTPLYTSGTTGYGVSTLIAIIDRLSAPPVSREEGGEELDEVRDCAHLVRALEEIASENLTRNGRCVRCQLVDEHATRCPIAVARAALAEPARQDNEATEELARLRTQITDWSYVLAEQQQDANDPGTRHRANAALRRYPAAPPSASPPERPDQINKFSSPVVGEADKGETP